MRVERCACGSDIAVPTGSGWAIIAEAIDDHADTIEHQAWRETYEPPSFEVRLATPAETLRAALSVTEMVTDGGRMVWTTPTTLTVRRTSRLERTNRPPMMVELTGTNQTPEGTEMLSHASGVVDVR